MSEIDHAELTHFARTTEDIYSLDELRTRLDEERPLRIKYGVDVTAPFLHIGHAVNLWMMRYLQERGHIVVFMIGDFTTLIGDPTGKSTTRKEIPREQIEANAKEFIKQVDQVLLTNPEVFEIRYNSEWYNKMGVDKFVSLLSMVTHSRLIQRDMFQDRIEAEREIHMHEMIYPVLQGYDSVMLEADLTIVGTDQLFNELMGRFYQTKFGQKPQVVITTRITSGINGVEKQSKSLGNYIALADSPKDKFGKTMSIPDSLIIPYFEVYTTVPMDEIHEMGKMMSNGNLSPMDAKKSLAKAVVERYHGIDVAQAELEWFTRVFSEQKRPKDIPRVEVSQGKTIFETLQVCLPDHSNSAIFRLIEQGGVRLNSAKLESGEERSKISDGDILRVGKRRWFNIALKN